MEIDPKLRRELTRRLEIQMNRHEMEITETWRSEIDAIYRRKYESLGALQVDLKNLIDRMTNRIRTLAGMVKGEK